MLIFTKQSYLLVFYTYAIVIHVIIYYTRIYELHIYNQLLSR
jgi:hypothetical protein